MALSTFTLCATARISNSQFSKYVVCESKGHTNIPETMISPRMWISLSKYFFPLIFLKVSGLDKKSTKKTWDIKYGTIWASEIATVTNESQWIYKKSLSPYWHSKRNKNNQRKLLWVRSIYLAFLVETVFKVSQEPQSMRVFSHWVSKTHLLHFYFGRPTTTHNLTKWKHPWHGWEHNYLLP